jgi:hypothetical protein
MGRAEEIKHIVITCLGLKRIAVANERVFLSYLLEMAAMEASKIELEIYLEEQEAILNQR